jgi:type VI secretion system protein ImpM
LGHVLNNEGARQPVAPDDGPSRSPGAFGKISAKGDFITRGLPQSFVSPWDTWLSGVIAGSQELLGDAWAQSYLEAPIWRFALAPGLAGPRPVVGILMPSVDRVGRYFPLTLANLLGFGAPLTRAVLEGVGWFHALEDLALASLEDDFDFARFENRLARLGLPFADADSDRASAAGAPDWHAGPWRFDLDLSGEMRLPSDDDLHHLAGRFVAGRSLWWGSGSEAIGPSFLLCNGLPETTSFAAMLDGRWQDWGWAGDATA